MQMNDRNNRSDVSLEDEEDSEGKPAKDGSPDGLGHKRELTGPCLDPGKRTPEILEKLIAQAGAFTLIPDGRFESIDFCFGANLKAGHSTPTPETRLQALDDPFPCLGLARGSPMCGESLLQDALLPLMKRHLIQAGCNVVPERLYVVDLILDRKIVESRRWQWYWVPHHRDYTAPVGVGGRFGLALKW